MPLFYDTNLPLELLTKGIIKIFSKKSKINIKKEASSDASNNVDSVGEINAFDSI